MCPHAKEMRAQPIGPVKWSHRKLERITELAIVTAEVSADASRTLKTIAGTSRAQGELNAEEPAMRDGAESADGASKKSVSA